jgi:hypothetical protein
MLHLLNRGASKTVLRLSWSKKVPVAREDHRSVPGFLFCACDLAIYHLSNPLDHLRFEAVVMDVPKTAKFSAIQDNDNLLF